MAGEQHAPDGKHVAHVVENPDSGSSVPVAPTVPHAAATDPDVLGTTHRDRVVLTVLAAICFLVMGVRWAQLSGWGSHPIEITRQHPLHYEYKLNPNAATWVEFMQLEGIGEILARRIVEDRESNGRFESVDDLARVRGIGPKTVEKLRPWVAVRPEPNGDD